MPSSRSAIASNRSAPSEIPEQVRVFELTERAGQVALDEGPNPVKRFGAELDEDTGRVLDVGLGRLDQPRCLPQL